MAATSAPLPRSQRNQRAPRERRRSRPATAATVAAIAALAIVAAACGRAESPPPSPTPPPTPTGSPDTTVDVTDDTFPTTVQEYAEAAVAAWAAPDLIRLSELATPEVHDTIIEIPGPPDLHWTFIECDEYESDPDATGTPDPDGATEDSDLAGEDQPTCSFHNNDGDYLVVTVDLELLGEPQAVVEVAFDPTSYPAEVEEYVAAFISAWQQGNLPRMELLALTEAASTFHQLPPTTTVDYTREGEQDGLEQVVLELTDPDGTETMIEAQVHPGLLGEPHAIREALPVES